jgi:dienelactone hydrolase
MGVRKSQLRRRFDPIRADGIRIALITADTDDGHRWDGLALTPRGAEPARRRLAVIVVHGSVGNYVSGLPRRVAFGLAEQGFTAISVNTRMANYGVFFGGGLLHRTPRDLDAWVDVARRLGHDRIVLLGYSLGATMVTYYQAVRRRSEVVGICTLAHPLSLPMSLRRRWERFGATPDYDTVTDRAREVIGESLDDDAGADEIFVVKRAAGPTEAPTHGEIWTYRTWWFSRGPEARHAVSREWIGRLDVPVALIQAGDDLLVPPSDGDELAARARAGAAGDVRHDIVPHANHVFSGRETAAVDRITRWLDAVIVPGRERVPVRRASRDTSVGPTGDE